MSKLKIFRAVKEFYILGEDKDDPDILIINAIGDDTMEEEQVISISNIGPVVEVDIDIFSDDDKEAIVKKIENLRNFYNYPFNQKEE